MVVDIYSGQDPLEMPLYTYADASRYINIPSSTVHSWSQGSHQKGKFYKPLINASGDDILPLSFHNLVELYVLSALRSFHQISSTKIRQALNNAKSKLGKERVLLSEELFTFGRDMFIEDLGDVINLNKGNQIVLKDILKNYLKRVQRDDAKIPIKLFPMIEGLSDRDHNPVSIDPQVSFGRPVVTGTGISTKVIASRINAGESPETVASDYKLSVDKVTEVLYYEKAA